jgi:diacylglycerol O-acyltransferase
VCRGSRSSPGGILLSTLTVVRPDRLSPLDASFLDLEDEVSHMHIGSVAIFAGPPPSHEDVVAMIAGKLHQVPRYRQIIRRVPGNLGRPVWIDDPHFNIDYHVRRTALPSPGGEAELRRLVGRLMSQQLDRAKPLWELWFVEGLEEGTWAMVAKSHHCLVDGVSGVELLAILMDVSPEYSKASPAEWQPAASPTGLGLLAETASAIARSPLEQLRTARAAARVPEQALAGARHIAQGFFSLAGALQPTPKSSLNGPIGPHRRWAWASTNVEDVKTVRHQIGGTFNDVVLAAITAGFRALLESRGEPVDRVVRTMVPVSVRGRDDTGLAVGDRTFNNKVSAMFAELPVNVRDPVARLQVISAQMEGLKESREALAGQVLTSMAGFAPPMLLALGLRVATNVPQRALNTVTTNVPGPQFPLYVRGRKMLKSYPYVPLWGQIRITIAIFSYLGQVNFGVTADYDTTPDVDVVCRGIEHGLQELLDIARARERRLSLLGGAPARTRRAPRANRQKAASRPRR